MGLKLDKAEIADLGKARKVIATKEHTTIVDGAGDKKKIEDRVSQMKAEFKESSSDYDKEKIQERMARLAGGVGVIKVGAFTETEMKAKKFKIEDALNATRAAVEEGIIAGGGVALARIAPKLDGFGKNLSDAEKAGVKVIKNSLDAPIRQIALNSGVEITPILAHIQNSDNPNMGYNFAKMVEVDMMNEGIVDPLKVTRLALENAVSIASTLVTAEAIVVDKPEPKSEAPAGGMY